MSTRRTDTTEGRWYDEMLELPEDGYATPESYTNALRIAILAMEGITRALGSGDISNVRVSFDIGLPSGQTYKFNYSPEED